MRSESGGYVGEAVIPGGGVNHQVPASGDPESLIDHHEKMKLPAHLYDVIDLTSVKYRRQCLHIPLYEIFLTH